MYKQGCPTVKGGHLAQAKSKKSNHFDDPKYELPKNWDIFHNQTDFIFRQPFGQAFFKSVYKIMHDDPKYLECAKLAQYSSFSRWKAVVVVRVQPGETNSTVVAEWIWVRLKCIVLSTLIKI